MKIHSQQRQRGVALVISLIILISLTMIGMTSIQRTTTDLSMAGNQRETVLMLQAAEVGLTAAEDFAQQNTSNGEYNDTNGLYEVVPSDENYSGPNYFNDITWGVNNSKPAGAAIATAFGLKVEPRFIIEYLGDRSQNPLAAINIGGYGSAQPGYSVSIYRSTARGVGVTGNSFRYVQSYFGKKID